MGYHQEDTLHADVLITGPVIHMRACTWVTREYIHPRRTWRYMHANTTLAVLLCSSLTVHP